RRPTPVPVRDLRRPCPPYRGAGRHPRRLPRPWRLGDVGPRRGARHHGGVAMNAAPMRVSPQVAAKLTAHVQIRQSVANEPNQVPQTAPPDFADKTPQSAAFLPIAVDRQALLELRHGRLRLQLALTEVEWAEQMLADGKMNAAGAIAVYNDAMDNL